MFPNGSVVRVEDVIAKSRDLVKKIGLTITLDVTENCNFIKVEDNRRVIATTDIPKGTLIYIGSPVLTYHDVDPEGLLASIMSLPQEQCKDLFFKIMYLYPFNDNDAVTRVRSAHENITDEQVMAVCTDPRYIIREKIRSNEFNCKTSTKHRALYLIGSKFNHACSPNCTHMISDYTNVMNIVTLRDVKKSEECTVTYNHSMLGVNDRSVRRKSILDRSYFECICEYCVDDSPVISYEEYFSIYNQNSLVTCLTCKLRKGAYKCARCKKVSYCSRECQMKDWGVHKKICKQ